MRGTATVERTDVGSPGGGSPGLRRVELGRRGTLVVRPVRAGDATALEALYDGLDTEARYRRFFCSYHPRRTFYERLATTAERGGYGVVAELERPGLPPVLVGEAGYVALPNGHGELALAVAEGWRGWLGPYLVDELVRAAAARGVPALEADVLATNGPMLAVLRARGAVTLERVDWSTVRLLVRTGAATGPAAIAPAVGSPNPAAPLAEAADVP